MERLRVQVIADIIYRLRAGQSQRAIAKDLGYARDTIRNYHSWAKERGYLDSGLPLPELCELSAELGPITNVRKSNISTVEPYRQTVEKLIDQGVEMVAIHRRLVRNHGYTGSYTSVRRFVSNIKPKEPTAVIRIETEPGREAQVDFGSAGRMYDPKTHKTRQSYCFVMMLSSSRHQYVEFVFDQKMETWIGCHRRAFRSFGGVPKEIVVDNLKAAVIKAGLDDAVLSEPYRQMARHYGFLIHPCRPRTPEHKGKVENGVHYVKRNFLAGAEFLDINDANRQVKEWVECEAGLRIHGTTAEQPIKRFYEKEKHALLPLPNEEFELLEVRQAKVHRDCHVQINGSYYSVPFKYIGRKLDIHVYERTVQIYSGVDLIVTHERAIRKGQRITRTEHYPEDKSIYLTRTREYCENHANRIGPRCGEVVALLLSVRPLDNLRAVQGIISLAGKYGDKRLEAACARALHYGVPRYRKIRDILRAGIDLELAKEQMQPELKIYEYARSAEEFFGGEVVSC
ncbi:MAG: IS21 family transposase [Dehalococcoidales bacterium]|nr:IS21 family transposase [Dehalococcoidales bacterium]